MPHDGLIKSVDYIKGDFLAAFDHKASEQNERTEISIETRFGSMIVKQIAGLVARRIVCEVEQGQELKQGERIGMIRFGSRVDIYFKKKKVLAKLGQNVVAGESLLASEC